jgi:hypothetical protein
MMQLRRKWTSNGHLSSQVLLDVMDHLHQKWECTSFETKFHQFAQKYGLGNNNAPNVINTGSCNMTNTNELQNESQGRFQTYCWGGKLGMHVLQGFDLPASTK